MIKEKLMKTAAVVMALACVISGNIYVSAASRSETIHVNNKQTWNSRPSLARSGNCGNVRVDLHAVYPDVNKKDDTYTRLHVRIKNTDGDLMMKQSYVVLNETDGYKYIGIKSGYLGEKKVVFQFRGNTYGEPAYAHVTYDAR